VKKLEFEDLTDFDLGLVKSQAVNTFVTTKVSDGGYALVESVFAMIKAMGYDIVQDETRQPTWSKKPKTQASQDPSKNWWKNETK
jgi:hypothetical protein